MLPGAVALGQAAASSRSVPFEIRAVKLNGAVTSVEAAALRELAGSLDGQLLLDGDYFEHQKRESGRGAEGVAGVLRTKQEELFAYQPKSFLVVGRLDELRSDRNLEQVWNQEQCPTVGSDLSYVSRRSSRAKVREAGTTTDCYITSIVGTLSIDSVALAECTSMRCRRAVPHHQELRRYQGASRPRRFRQRGENRQRTAPACCVVSDGRLISFGSSPALGPR